MTIEKLKSGSYRITEMRDGKRFRVTIDHEPRKKEAQKLIREKMESEGYRYAEAGSVQEMAEKYIRECDRKGLSPSTLNSYRSIVRNTPTWFLDEQSEKLSYLKMAKCVDEYGSSHSSKSTKNFLTFYKCALSDFRRIDFSMIIIPRAPKKSEYEPTTKDIQRIMEYEKGSKYELVLSLLCLGLRRGEALAITADDISEDNILTIDKDMIYKGDGYIIKDHPKTEASNRRILIPENIADMIREKGKAFDGNPHMVGKHLNSVQSKLGIPHFRLHILRHYASALLHKSGFTDQQIMAYMGWSCIQTLHGTYNYNLDPEESQRPIASTFGVLFTG